MKTNFDKDYKNDSIMEKEGIWFKFTGTASFRMRRFGGANSSQVKQAMAKYHKPYARLIEKEALDESLTLDIMVRTLVAASLIDWKGVEIDGVDTKYSSEIAIKFLKGLPNLFQELWSLAIDDCNYREELEDLGNSSPTG